MRKYVVSLGLLLTLGHSGRAEEVSAGAPPMLGPSTMALAVAVPERPRRAKHVLIISEDGMPGGALDKKQLKWHEYLKKNGAFTTRALTIREASTLPAHASMLSGYHPSVHGLTWNNWRPKKGYIKTKSIFARARESGMTTAFFTGKSKLRHIVPPGTVGMYERPGYYCKKVAEEAAEYLVSDRPELAFVHFSDADELGHSKGWYSRQQWKAMEETDRCLGILFEALDKAGLAQDTLIIVSADHGGHNKVHSGGKLVDREIPWMAMGPGVRPGFHMTENVSTLDTAATALYALGLPLPADIVGKPRLDIFLDAPKK